MKKALPLLLFACALALSPNLLSAETAPAPEERPAQPIEKPARPERPENIGQERKDVLKTLVEDFRSKAEEYKNTQQDLVRKFKGASAEERAKIREQIKEIQDQFRQAKDQFREEMKDSSKVKDLKRAVDAKAERPSSRGGASREE